MSSLRTQIASESLRSEHWRQEASAQPHAAFRRQATSFVTAIGRLLASGLTVFTYLFFRALIAFPAYQRGTYRIVDEAIDAPRIPAKAGGTRVIRFFVDCYHQSFFYARLKRRGVRCRYLPSCTDYAVRAVDKYGYRRGLMLASGRFRRCNPSYKHDYLDFP